MAMEPRSGDAEASHVRFLPAGDTALVVEFGDRIDRRLSERVIGLADRIREERPTGVVETVATFRSLLVRYDPHATTGAALSASIEALVEAGESSTRQGRLFVIPVCYDRICAPDLDDVAERTGRSAEDVVRLHTGRDYHVYSIGFLPGYAYMGDVAPEIVLPRRAEPRVRVPPGSVAIAAGMTGVYPVESPGGWHLIGATAVRFFDPGWPEPSLLAPGDTVRFRPISMAEYQSHRAGGSTAPQSPEGSR